MTRWLVSRPISGVKAGRGPRTTGGLHALFWSRPDNAAAMRLLGYAEGDAATSLDHHEADPRT